MQGHLHVITDHQHQHHPSHHHFLRDYCRHRHRHGTAYYFFIHLVTTTGHGQNYARRRTMMFKRLAQFILTMITLLHYTRIDRQLIDITAFDSRIQ